MLHPWVRQFDCSLASTEHQARDGRQAWASFASGLPFTALPTLKRDEDGSVCPGHHRGEILFHSRVLLIFLIGKHLFVAFKKCKLT